MKEDKWGFDEISKYKWEVITILVIGFSLPFISFVLSCTCR